MTYAPGETWTLESIVPGGPGGAPFRDACDAMEAELRDLVARGDALPAHPHPADLGSVLLRLEDVGVRLGELMSYADCAAAVDARGPDAMRGENRANDLGSLLARASVVPEARVARASEAEFQALLDEPDLAHLAGWLRDLRRSARLLLPEAEEALCAELARDGVNAWGELYNMVAGGLVVRVDRGAGPEDLSAGQAATLLFHEDGVVRERAFEAVKGAWRSVGPTCAKVLTHLTGTRQTLNDRRGLDPLDEPLIRARIERRTLDAMMEAARAARPLIDTYLGAKARLLGKEALSWTDVVAPLGATSGPVTFEAAQDVVVEQFARFSPRLADYATRALRERWIEVEDRPNKRTGGFCAGMPVHKESRIFMTWGHNARSLSTLAHELGHAYHNEVLFELPPGQRRLPMTLAETASTFGETLVREAELARATDPAVRLRLLDGALSDAVAFLANIPARYELELALYRMRREGPLDAEALEAETAAIFGRWYGPHVAGIDPVHWASKLHYYISSLSFYNFPYTFGYLFSSLVYEHFRPLGAAGAPGYDRLLRRTGDAWAEPIAAEELGADLGDPGVWTAAMASVTRDLEAFCELASAS